MAPARVRFSHEFLRGGEFSAEHFAYAHFNSSVANLKENISSRLV
jgi:hypothetical protein